MRYHLKCCVIVNALIECKIAFFKVVRQSLKSFYYAALVCQSSLSRVTVSNEFVRVYCVLYIIHNTTLLNNNNEIHKRFSARALSSSCICIGASDTVLRYMVKTMHMRLLNVFQIL